MEINDRRGQSTVEYILLLAVLTTLVTAFFRSDLFIDYLGKEGSIFRNYAEVISYNYRHGRPRPVDGADMRNTHDYQGEHDTYKNLAGKSKFVIPLGVYPK